ncbi:MAG: hypothetical protein L0H73_03525 [Nitrococcus sp.]|nr:hypothetical protein [Nitrococcus sp.]
MATAFVTPQPAAQPKSPEVDFADVQGLVRFGHRQLSEASFLLLDIADCDAAKRWLQSAPVTSALMAHPPPDTALQVAFTCHGLKALGVAAEFVGQFSDPFIAGMAGEENRSRRLGDVGRNAPSAWAWGGSLETMPHLIAMLYARPGGLEAWEEAIKGEHWAAAFRVQARLPTATLGELEPFGFADGISQPRLDWRRERSRGGKDQLAYANVITLGEVLLGYPNEYGRYTRRPLIDVALDPRAADLSPAEDRPSRRDLGRNGTYLVLRQLHQDVRGFWRCLDQESDSDPKRRERLARAMVGRTRAGVPLVALDHDWIEGVGPDREDIAANNFTFAADPHGEHCPFGAHIRRANPRTGDLPDGSTGVVVRLLRMLGFRRGSFRDDLIASSRLHRLVRRGRAYGSRLSPQEALQPGGADEEERGLQFFCLGANLSRQFEFVQNAWIQSTKFAGLSAETDPLLGNRELGGLAADRFSRPQPGHPARRITGMPRFVTVRGGAYFFLPGIRALRYLAGAPSTAAIASPVPPAPTLGKWQPLLRGLHRALVGALHIERRLEPFFRAAFNRLLRERLAALIQYLINRGRPDEGLALAEERIAPDEEASLDSIIQSFGGYIRRTYRPGTAERGGNTKTHGIVRAQVTIRDDLPEHMRRGIFKEPRTFPAYVRYSGPGPNLPRDIEDVGFVSMALKIMGVPGTKLLDDEKHTQDMLGVCTPTFVTPNTRENAKLQIWSFREMPVFYFLNPFDFHLLDFFMQSLWNETQYNPLGARYWSCVPYLLGEGQAMMYSFAPRSKVVTDIPGVPFGHVPANYLRDNMVATLARQDVDFDLLVQVQTDAQRMPIENASVRWPERLSPFVPAASIHIPSQRFDTWAHVELAKRLSMNPWHCLPEHRPLGNQSRARLRMYSALSRLRQAMNQTPHVEPTGDEELD